MTANVDNFFDQPTGGGTDNKLTVNGTLTTGSGSNFNMNGTMTTDAASTMVVKGAMDTNGSQDLRTKLVTLPIGDVSAAGSVWVVPGIAGTIVKISNVIDAAITVADAGLTFEIDGTAVTGAAITIANASSAAGDVDSSTPTALNVITASEAIEVVKDGSSTTASNGVVTFEILLS